MDMRVRRVEAIRGWVFLGRGQKRRVFIGRGIDRGYSQCVVGDGVDDGRCSLRTSGDHLNGVGITFYMHLHIISNVFASRGYNWSSKRCISRLSISSG